jgi:DNA-binding NarL/FixJ family response regulator
MKRARILLADDHTLIVEALRVLLQEEFEVVGTAADGRAMLRAAATLSPDLVVLDIGMPLLNGLDAGEQLKQSQPKVKIIYLTQNRDPVCAAEALRRNASGYLLKSAAAAELSQAIREALLGRKYVSPVIAEQMVSRNLYPNQPDRKTTDLRPREREVLQLLAEGKSMKEAAGILNISPRTVEFHKYRMMEALGVTSTAELIQYAVKRGLVES